jgi:HTH-type transcriptional regulator / antitoxin HigA
MNDYIVSASFLFNRPREIFQRQTFQDPQLLISWRIARHWTQRQLADRLGMHENQIQKYEAEDYSCASLETITRIAAILKEAG